MPGNIAARIAALIPQKIDEYHVATFLATGAVPTAIALCQACLGVLFPAVPASTEEAGPSHYAGLEIHRVADMRDCVVHRPHQGSEAQ